MNPNIAALQEAIHKTLAAIAEGRGQVGLIVESTSRELERIESEYAEMKTACLEAIARVEALEVEARQTRNRLAEVSRSTGPQAEAKMRQAYTEAEAAQTELTRWRERETHLRCRRDDLARQLKMMQVTYHQAEVLMMKFDHVRDYLATGFQGLSSTLESAKVQLMLGFQMLQMQEEERHWLAQVLHDGPMQSLASVAMRLESHCQLEEETKRNVQHQLRAVIHDLRRIAFDLHPPLLDDLGLIPALRRYVQQWMEWTGLLATVRLTGIEAPLEAAEKMAVFRAVQEALHNVHQHAHAHRVDILAVYGPDTLCVRVRDDGVGIQQADWSGWLASGRIGLTMANQRLYLLQGRLDLRQREGGGTEVVIQVPLRRGGAAGGRMTDSGYEGGETLADTATDSRGYRG
ncbi:sensor histidine kinase [Alicyclobacillus herbarius]|uniref:sensor histidine kinase n=1 Tax=Alicyclobacillus herbarius TaxID=122960 RepID=UPI00047D7F4B|nr:ATP-binding protein [Alicyclobacillus herbarius]